MHHIQEFESFAKKAEAEINQQASLAKGLTDRKISSIQELPIYYAVDALINQNAELTQELANLKQDLSELAAFLEEYVKDPRKVGLNIRLNQISQKLKS